jgi:hypothetical protein
MAAALRTQGVEFEEHVFPDEIHGFLLHRSWITAYGLTSDFFGRHLRMATPIHAPIHDPSHALAPLEAAPGTPPPHPEIESGTSRNRY